MHGAKIKEMYIAMLNGDMTKVENLKTQILQSAQGGNGDGNSWDGENAEFCFCWNRVSFQPYF